MQKWICPVCDYIYDESTETKWEELSDEYVCPLCSAPKSVFIVNE